MQMPRQMPLPIPSACHTVSLLSSRIARALVIMGVRRILTQKAGGYDN
jgi:hypothetical protein